MSDLHVSQVAKTFHTAAGDLPVLSGADLEMQRGEAIAVTGPSGSGKSTLLYIIGTLDEPTSGNVKILETDVAPLRAAALAKFRNAEIGFIFQDHHLLPQCSVLENVLLPTLAGSGAGKDEEARARQLLQRVGLGERLDHRPSQISGGERQRVAVCRALINQPSLLLADEPTGNLDRKTATAVGSLLLELCQEQNTMLITVTHSVELAERFPRWCELMDGKLVQRQSAA